MGEPDNFGARERIAEAGDGGKGVDNVAEGAEAHDEKTRLRHAGPCGWHRVASAWNDLWDRRRWLRGCRGGRRRRARGRCRRCSRCPWRERWDAILRAIFRRSVRGKSRRSPRPGGRRREGRGLVRREWGGQGLSAGERWSRR